MIKTKINGHKIEVYDSIENLPIVRFHKFNKLMLIDSGIGSDLSSVDKHISRIISFSNLDKKKELYNELINMRQNIYMIQQEVSPVHLAFCSLIKSIDGEDVTDVSDDGIKDLYCKINGASLKEVTALFDAVKKKIDKEMIFYFPSIANNSRIKEYEDMIARRAILQLDGIIEDKDVSEEVEKDTDKIVTYDKPILFSGENNFEVKYDKDFETMCLFLSQSINVSPKKMTVLEFYNANEYIQEQARQREKQMTAK